MSERKVLSKYYPADFDPNALTRRRGPKQKGPKVQVVRLMAPFGMRCTSCGEYIYRGRKFNARKETNPEERYLGVQIHRFYIKCTRCSSQITFRTDPANMDYVCERGAKRNTDPWKRALGEDGAPGTVPEDETDEARLDRLEEQRADEEERNAMAELEAKTVDAKREMAVADALDEIRTRNARIARANAAGAGAAEALVADDRDEERLRQDAEDAEAARRAFAWAREQAADTQEELIAEEDMVGWDGGPLKSSSASASASEPESLSEKPAASTAADMPPPSFKRQVKKKTDRAALLGIKKKT